MPVVRFTSNLKRFYPNLSECKVEATNIAELIANTDTIYPGIKNYLVDDQDSLRKHVNIFINNTMIQDRKTLGDELKGQDEVYIMQALSGG